MKTTKSFIATDQEEMVIFGVGSTPKRAEHDAMRGTEGSVETYHYYQQKEPELYTGFIPHPATKSLVKMVMDRGRVTAWGHLSDGTCCTLDEAAHDLTV